MNACGIAMRGRCTDKEEIRNGESTYARISGRRVHELQRRGDQ